MNDNQEHQQISFSSRAACLGFIVYILLFVLIFTII
jgi:hypothetical protein